MKSKLLLSTALFLLGSTVRAQKPEPAQAVVHYKFSHLSDTTKRDSLYTENMLLLIGKNASTYKSRDRQLRDANLKQQIKAQMATAIAGGGAINLQSTGRNTGTSTELYQFAAEKKLIRKERVMASNYLITEALPVINWKISSDTASFSGLHCQKAEAHFKGRDYIAWFCADLPYRTGPWKLNGLPGLIIEAADTKNEVVFQFAGMEGAGEIAKKGSDDNLGVNMVKFLGSDDSSQDQSVIALPADGIVATEADLTKLKDAVKKDPNAYMQSALAASGLSGSVSAIRTTTVRTPNTGSVRPVNNPIELPEKK
jgi:GLPGLI family protein